MALTCQSCGKEYLLVKDIDGAFHRSVCQCDADKHSCEICGVRKKPLTQAALNREQQDVAFYCREHGSDDDDVREFPEVHPTKQVKEKKTKVVYPEVNNLWRTDDPLYLFSCSCLYSWFTNKNAPQRCSACDAKVDSGEEIGTVDVSRVNNVRESLSVLHAFTKGFPSTAEGHELRIFNLKEPTGIWKKEDEPTVP